MVLIHLTTHERRDWESRLQLDRSPIQPPWEWVIPGTGAHDHKLSHGKFMVMSVTSFLFWSFLELLRIQVQKINYVNRDRFKPRCPDISNKWWHPHTNTYRPSSSSTYVPHYRSCMAIVSTHKNLANASNLVKEFHHQYPNKLGSVVTMTTPMTY